jgi:hypothetical protein
LIDDFPEVREIAAYLDTQDGKLTEAQLNVFNARYFDKIYDVSFLPSLLAKPSAYAEEKERRIVLEMDADLANVEIFVRDESLARFIKPVS